MPTPKEAHSPKKASVGSKTPAKGASKAKALDMGPATVAVRLKAAPKPAAGGARPKLPAKATIKMKTVLPRPIAHGKGSPGKKATVKKGG